MVMSSSGEPRVCVCMCRSFPFFWDYFVANFVTAVSERPQSVLTSAVQTSIPKVNDPVRVAERQQKDEGRTFR